MREGWVKKSISEICDKASSNIAQNKIADIDGDYPVYGASGYVQNVDFYHRDTPYIGIVKDGSGVGRVNIYPAYSSLLGTMQYIIPKEGYLLGYVAYALKGLNLSSFASGAAIPHIYFKDYGKCKIDVPPLIEQERIVAELDLLSGIIEKKKEQLKAYDQLAQSIFYSMFGDPIDNPKGWEAKKLGKLGECVSGGTPSRRIEQNFKGTINWFSAGELNKMFLNDSIEKITKEALDNSNAKLCSANSLFIGMYDTAAFKLGIPLKESASNQACANVDLYVDNVIWLYYSLLLMREEALKYRHGARQKNLSLSFIKNFIVPVPPLSLQQEFAEKVEAIERQKALVQQSIEETQTMFDYTMDKYFG